MTQENKLLSWIKEHPVISILVVYGVLSTAINVVYRRDKPLLIDKDDPTDD